MEFLNIGGGEILVIVLLALILFGPEDIIKIMRTLGKYTRSARDMWSQFNATLQQEYMGSEELSEALEETKASVAEAKEVIDTIKTSVGQLTTSATSEVAAAQKAINTEAREGAAAIQSATRAAAKAVTVQESDAAPQAASAPQAEPEMPEEAVASVAEPQDLDEPRAEAAMPPTSELDDAATVTILEPDVPSTATASPADTNPKAVAGDFPTVAVQPAMDVNGDDGEALPTVEAALPSELPKGTQEQETPVAETSVVVETSSTDTPPTGTEEA